MIVVNPDSLTGVFRAHCLTSELAGKIQIGRDKYREETKAISLSVGPLNGSMK
jgi:hypothetical protein